MMNQKYLIWYKLKNSIRLEVVGCDNLLLAQKIWNMMTADGGYTVDSKYPT